MSYILPKAARKVTHGSRELPLLVDPATSTFPLFSNVAVLLLRALFMLPVGMNIPSCCAIAGLVKTVRLAVSIESTRACGRIRRRRFCVLHKSMRAPSSTRFSTLGSRLEFMAAMSIGRIYNSVDQQLSPTSSPPSSAYQSWRGGLWRPTRAASMSSGTSLDRQPSL